MMKLATCLESAAVFGHASFAILIECNHPGLSKVYKASC